MVFLTGLFGEEFFSLTMILVCGYHSIRMDNLPKENNNAEESQTQGTGEIFSAPSESGYQAVTEAETPTETSTEQPFNPPGGEPPPADTGITAPPPFEENKLKKYIVMIFAFIAVAAIIFGIFSLVRRLFLPSGTKPSGNITLTYWGLWEEKEIMQPLIDEYKRSHSNVTINYLKQDPKLYRERLQAAINRGEGPDIFRFHNTWVPMLTAELSPLPKDIYSDDEFTKTFYPVASMDLKAGGNFYGIPLTIDGLLLFYNEDILKSANIAVPTTWVDIQDIVPKITVKEKGKIVTAAIALGTTDNVEHFSDILGLMMLQNGVQLTKSLFTCSDTTTTGCAAETLSFYHKFAELPDNTWDETLENSTVTFAGGKVAFIFAPSWQVFTIKEINPNLNFKTAAVPQLPCSKQPCVSTNWATYWVEGVSSKSKNAQAAWEFLKYLSQPASLQKLYEGEVKLRKLFGEPYARMDMGKTLLDNPYLAPLITSAPSMKSFPLASRTNDGDTGIDSSLIKYLKDAVNSLSKGVSPETALQTVDSGFKQVFSRFNVTATAP